MLQLILEKEIKCNSELDKISKITKNVAAALIICRESRCLLRLAKKQFTLASLSVLAGHKRKQTIHQLLKNLKMIKALVSMKFREYLA